MGWTKIDPVFALTFTIDRASLLQYPFINSTLRTRRGTFSYGGVMVVAWFHEITLDTL
jgi:hypothetical protein